MHQTTMLSPLFVLALGMPTMAFRPAGLMALKPTSQTLSGKNLHLHSSLTVNDEVMTAQEDLEVVPVMTAQDLQVVPSTEQELWDQLEDATDTFLASRGRVYFNLKEMKTDHPELVAELEEGHGLPINFEVPKTFEEGIATYLASPSMQFSFSALFFTMFCRMSLGPLGLSDLLVGGGIKVFWELHEWVVHYLFYHGNDGKASHPFEIHDHHHSLPYYHVATESLRMCIVWYVSVSALTCALVGMGVPATLATTGLAMYTACGIQYMTFHYIAHTKMPLKGWLQEARKRHVKHHIYPESHFNMGPNAVDSLLKTDTH